MAHGVKVNFAKTKIMIAYHGKGSTTAKENRTKAGLTKITTPLSDQLVDIVYRQ